MGGTCPLRPPGIYAHGHGAHTREEQEHADEDINSNDNI